MKSTRPKMTKARMAARGQECMVRIPGVCNGNPETVVLAHYRINSGAGMKPDDEQGAWACSACHDAIDGRSRYSNFYTTESLRLMHAEGVFRTQEALRRMAA